MLLLHERYTKRILYIYKKIFANLVVLVICIKKFVYLILFNKQINLISRYIIKSVEILITDKPSCNKTCLANDVAS